MVSAETCDQVKMSAVGAGIVTTRSAWPVLKDSDQGALGIGPEAQEPLAHGVPSQPAAGASRRHSRMATMLKRVAVAARVPATVHSSAPGPESEDHARLGGRGDDRRRQTALDLGVYCADGRRRWR